MVLSLSLEDPVKLPRTVRFIPNLFPAKPAAVFIPVAVGQDQQKKFPHRHCLTAFGAVEFCSLELVKICLLAATTPCSIMSITVTAHFHLIYPPQGEGPSASNRGILEWTPDVLVY